MLYVLSDGSNENQAEEATAVNFTSVSASPDQSHPSSPDYGVSFADILNVKCVSPLAQIITHRSPKS